ncbi:hypothetical protein [Streptomyces sp. NPDC051909]|uniref:hypothetical protein n=1 Tax=Streptomyces sp. NPDC051909 TaxID=3154944 RepID=UPI003420F630
MELYQITDGLMEHLTPLIGIAAQLAILDRTEALALEMLHDDRPLPRPGAGVWKRDR